MTNSKEEVRQRQKLKDSIETFAKLEIECWCCSEKANDYDMEEAVFANELYKEGWRYVSSEKFQAMGPLCPECAAKSDAELGE